MYIYAYVFCRQQAAWTLHIRHTAGIYSNVCVWVGCVYINKSTQNLYLHEFFGCQCVFAHFQKTEIMFGSYF